MCIIFFNKCVVFIFLFCKFMVLLLPMTDYCVYELRFPTIYSTYAIKFLLIYIFYIPIPIVPIPN